MNWGQKVEGTAEAGGMGAWEIMGTSERFSAVRDVLTLLDLTAACLTKGHKDGGREGCQKPLWQFRLEWI